jgi:hypothetical protein
MVPTNKKSIFIVALVIILLLLLSHSIYVRFYKREGFDLGKIFRDIGNIFGMIGKIIAFITKIGVFFCWLADAVQWCIDTVAALFYYVGNLFSGCILFYWFDMVMGTTWYILYIIFSIAMYGKEFTEISDEISDWMDAIDDTCYEWTGIHAFKYSDETTKKCYKLKFEPFPEWPRELKF